MRRGHFLVHSADGQLNEGPWMCLISERLFLIKSHSGVNYADLIA